MRPARRTGASRSWSAHGHRLHAARVVERAERPDRVLPADPLRQLQRIDQRRHRAAADADQRRRGEVAGRGLVVASLPPALAADIAADLGRVAQQPDQAVDRITARGRPDP